MQNLLEKIPNYYLLWIYGKVRGLLHSWILPFNDSCQEIIPSVFLGNISTAYNKEKLKELGITHIINTVIGVSPAFPNDFQYLHIELRDHTYEDIKTHFDKINKYIDNVLNNNGKIYIHCLCGISRSATIVSAYLMYKNNLSRNDAIDFIKSKRPIVNPNNGFKEQLDNYELEIKNPNLIKSCLF
jgi:protein-tyrosine phosphatase